MRIKNCDLRDFFWCASLALALAAAAQPGALGQSKAARSAASQDARTRSSEDGNQAYTTNCAGCHGLDGKGGERAPDIATRPHARQLSDAAILSILRTGVPNTAMPSFRFLTPAIRKSSSRTFELCRAQAQAWRSQEMHREAKRSFLAKRPARSVTWSRAKADFSALT